MKLETFEGPIDLLLHLVRKQDFDIATLPIATITRQYLDFLRLIETLHLDAVGEFLVLAATLLFMKSKILLPFDESDPDDSEEDTRAALAQRLAEHQQYKEAAEKFSHLQAQWRLVHTRPRTEPTENVVSLRQVSLFDLLDAFKIILDKTPEPNPLEIVPDEETVEQRSLWLLRCLERQTPIPFATLFAPGETRLKIITTFLALLELIRKRLVTAIQDQALGPILLVRTANAVVT